MSEKIRVHNLAKELNVTSKAILDKCQSEGLDVKNHMSTLSAGLEATIREWFSEGAHKNVIEQADRIDLKKVRTEAQARRRAARKAKAEAEAASAATESAVAIAELPELTEESMPPPAEVEPAEEAAPAAPEAPAQVAAEAPPAVAEPPAPAAPEEAEPPAVEAPVEKSQDARAAAAEVPAEPPPEAIAPAGPQNIPAPAKLRGPRVVRYEAPEEYALPRRGPRRRATGEGEEGPVVPDVPAAAGPAKGKTARKRPETEAERAPRRSNVRRRGADETEEKLIEWNDQDLAERRARLRGATGRRMSARRASERTRGGGGPAGPVTAAQVTEPIVMKDFCAAIGEPFQRIYPLLTKEHNLMLGTNSILPRGVAELLAAHFGVELTVIEAKTKLDQLREELQSIERKNPQTRPPIVAMLGHVDHGKTSLLDAIRRSGVAKREDGGITQHISSYHFKSDKAAVTFLDTPGHEAFTALRARGAQITDVVVLVIAADDGIMPQTVEAINHAKAAGVPIVVALNKIDLGTQNINKIYGQLTEHGLTPSGDWGGEVDVIQTSATTGKGVTELVEHLSALAEVYEFKADPTIAAFGTVIEAQSRQGVGAVLQVIVREGTLSVGDVVICGNSFGKVRALVDDRGKRLKKAGPSMPVEIWGMNEVPNAGDHFYQLDNMQRAKEIAEEIKQKRVTNARATIQKAQSLEDLLRQRSDADVPELNVIVKGDVDGSVDALTSTLNRFPSDQVKLTVLHAGVGAVTDSDVHLGKASNAIIIAFRVIATTQTKKLAEREGVEIRPYKVIYDVTDDIRSAMEGLLAPEEIREARGSAEVRELFRISKLLVAGCYVRDGVVGSNHVARVVRDGAVVRDNCRFASLRRFKDDVKEVRAGMECGIRLEGFDDIKIGDAIETFEVKKVARKLD